MSEIEVAHAKLTVHLHVTGTRPDGYHLIDAEMVSLDLADTLEFSSGSGLEIIGNDSLSTGHDNLVSKALTLAGTDAHVRLHKNIPAGGGLGGGSSDAAAVLRWAGVTDTELASRLGADVPFCLAGGRARVTGIGERLEALPYELRSFTLLLPPFGVDTAAVYRAYDELGPQSIEVRNHLAVAAEQVEPRLRHYAKKLARFTGQEAILAGSGSTLFVEGAWPTPPAEELEGARWLVATTVKSQG